MENSAGKSRSDAAPFLKWAGGKRQLLDQYRPHFPAKDGIHHYFEPFIGSAAVFFHLQPPKALLSDANRQLVEVYQMVQKDVEGVIEALKRHRNEKDYYYQVRAQDPSELIPQARAARLIFLNRTCYNGLFRVNRSGRFNVPFGRYKNPTICHQDRLRAASAVLQKADLAVLDFETAVESARTGDFVYFDPPYVPISPSSSFTSYNRYGFGIPDHERLAATFHKLTARNVHVMLSNSDTSLVRDLYSGRGYDFIEIQARRNINSNARRRGPVGELLILNRTVLSGA